MYKVIHHPHTMKALFTRQDIKNILNAYPDNGVEYCARILNKPIHQVRIKINKLRKLYNLKLNPTLYRQRLGHRKNYRKTNGFAVDPYQFIHLNTKEVSYILGLLWADGFIYSNGNQNRISIEMIEEDLQYLLPIFKSTGSWSVSFRNRFNRRPQMKISTNNRPLFDFLKSHGYSSKSDISADKILQQIPQNLQHYWFRGLVDGDGCFYVNADSALYQFSISSTYQQDWAYVISLLNTLDVRYSINKKEQICLSGNVGKGSSVRITNRVGIQRIGQYIYKNFEEDKIGLPRKYSKYRLICDGPNESVSIV